MNMQVQVHHRFSGTLRSRALLDYPFCRTRGHGLREESNDIGMFLLGRQVSVRSALGTDLPSLTGPELELWPQGANQTANQLRKSR